VNRTGVNVSEVLMTSKEFGVRKLYIQLMLFYLLITYQYFICLKVSKIELPMEELKASFKQIQGFYFVSSLTGQVCTDTLISTIAL
jgi:hypothetical protein